MFVQISYTHNKNKDHTRTANVQTVLRKSVTKIVIVLYYNKCSI